MLPRITLITPSFQQREFLTECLGSVHGQGYPDLEHIVVDGGSTDGSVQVIESAATGLAWWCSEPDRGQSHAINKGLERATGSVFGWLNSDDLLLPGALHRVGEAFAADPDLLVHGGRRIFRSTDGTERVSSLDDATDRAGLFIHPCVNQQSTFYRLDAVRAVHGVEEALHYTMDLELWWHILFANEHATLRFDPVDLAVFRSHPASKTSTTASAFRDETAMILRNMARQLGQQDLVEVLDIGYPGGPSLRPMPLQKHHAPMVRRMIVHFLLKWHGVVHTRTDFAMMRTFLATVPLRPEQLEPSQQGTWTTLCRQLDVPGWLAFRIRRKLDHLFG